MYERFASIVQSKAGHHLIQCLFLLVALFMAKPVKAEAIEYDTRMFLLINNSFSLCDYKMTSSKYDEIYNAIKKYDSNYRDLDKDESSTVKPTGYTRNLMVLSGIPSGSTKYEKDLAIDYESIYENSITYKSWLIKNNILERPVEVTSSGVSLVSAPYLRDTANANRAIFLSLLYKAKNGPIQSNIVYSVETMGHPLSATQQTPTRAWGDRSAAKRKDYWGLDQDANFVGDYVAYTTSNVWELYLAEMVDANIISTTDFDPSYSPAGYFLNGYLNSNSASVPWKTDGVISQNKNALGYYYSVSVNSGLQVTSTGEPLYFRKSGADTTGLTNELTVYEALEYIYKYLSQTESAMSDMESSIIAFKYGLSQFYNIPDKYKRYVYYAVAKGIIPYDDTENRFLLDGNLSNGQMYELIYRVANKGARYDFSEVTLTDTEQEFMNKGYSRSTLSVYSVTVNPITSAACYKYKSSADKAVCPDGEITDSSETASSSSKDSITSTLSALLEPFTIKSNAASNSKLNTYYVVRWFDYKYEKNGEYKPTENYYTFKTDTGKTYVLDSEKKAGLPEAFEISNKKLNFKTEVSAKTANLESASVDYDDNQIITSGGKKYKVLKVTFVVKAASKTSALQYIQNRIGFNCKSQVLIDGYSTVLESASSQDTNVVNTVISQTALKQLKDIAIIRDKVLVNKVTGVQALFVDDPTYNYALVGNTIFTQSDVISYTDGKEVYYNLNVILHLLSGSASCRDLGLNDYSNINNAILISSDSIDSRARVEYEFDAGMNDKYAYYLHADLNDDDKSKISVTSTSSTYSVYNIFYDIDSIVTGVNTVCKTITVNYPLEDSTVPVDVTLVVDFAYVFPEFSDGSVEDIDLKDVDTYEEYQSLLYKCPKEDTLAAEWWTYNYNVNNALLNFLFETKNIVYCPTGYLVPHLTVLLPDYLTNESIDFDYDDDKGATEDARAREQWNLTEPFIGGSANDTHGISVCNTILNLATKDLLLGLEDNTNWWQLLFNGHAIESIANEKGITEWEELKKAVQNYYSFEAVYASRESKGMYTLFSDKNGVKNNVIDKEGNDNTRKYGLTRYVMLTTGKLYRYTQTCNFWYDANKKALAPAIEANNTSVNKESVKLTVHSRTSQLCELDTSVFENSSFAARTRVKCSQGGFKTNSNYSPGSSTESSSTEVIDPSNNYQLWKFSTLPGKLKDIYKTQVNKDTRNSLLDEYTSVVPCFDVGTSYLGIFESTIKKDTNGKYYLTKYMNKSLGTELLEAGVYSSDSGILCDMDFDDESLKDIVIDYDYADNTAIGINGVEVSCLDAQIINTAGDLSGAKIKSNYKSVSKTDFKYYYAGGCIYKAEFCESNEAYLVKCKDSECEQLIKDEKTVTIIPRLYVKPKYMQLVAASSCSLDQTDCTVKNCKGFHNTPTNMEYVFKGMQTSVSALNQGFYQYSTIQRVIDSMLYKDSDVSDISALPSGHRLVIGDLKFVKSGGYWISYPIKETSATKSHLRRLQMGEAKRALELLFSGMSVTAEGALFPLFNYVDCETVSLATQSEVQSLLKESPISGRIMLGLPDSDCAAVYDKTGTEMLSKADSTDSKYFKEVNGAKYYAIKFKFKAPLYARPLNTDDNEWAIMLCNDYIMGSNALSIYNMKLDYDLDKDISLTLLSSKFDYADNIEGAKISFEELYKDTKANSWFWYLRYTFVYYSMYLVFVVWITRIREVKGFFKLLYHEETGKIDLLALTTFGILNLKRDISYNRAVAITLLFAFFDAIIIYAL